MASQLVTHALIRDAGFTLPPDAEAWDDLSVEQAYDRLPTPEDGDPGDDGDASSSHRRRRRFGRRAILAGRR